MNYAWVLDQTKCIGCHACSTACKSENDVPVGVHRTWVKNVDVGSYPNVRRHFAVLRCNHCADPPCVDICPVTAMYQRSDGIVDIDHDRCIGCKACMQACPYDAIHVDPTDDTAAKCHFCAHRVDNGLLPSCVVVCPVEAIAFGDMGDPRSRVGKILGSTAVQVRKPEQGTQPKTFYVGAHAATLDPLAAYHDSSYMWADRKPGNAKDDTEAFSLWALLQPRNGNGKRNARDRMPPAKVSYDVHHEIPWRTKVSAYLWTKSISAGVMFVAALAVIGLGAADPTFTWWAPMIALAALAATGVLLIADLKRPERFWYILAKPQWTSWLTRGAFIITAYGAFIPVWLLAVGHTALDQLALVALPLAFGTAVYTAFLFGQCEGRDLWQGSLVGLGLTIQMLLAGSAALLLAAEFAAQSDATMDFLAFVFFFSLSLQLASVVLGELTAHHGSSNASAAATVMVRGRYASWFWFGLVIGVVGPLALIFMESSLSLGAVLALIGLFAYEHAFVMSGQSVPLS